MNSRMKKYTKQCLEGSQMEKLLCLWSWGASPSWHMVAFTNPEFCKPYALGISTEVSSHRYD